MEGKCALAEPGKELTNVQNRGTIIGKARDGPECNTIREIPVYRRERAMSGILSRKEWPEVGLVITDEGDSILIRQNNTCYRASKWRLNESLIWYVNTAVSCGFKFFRAKNHPQRDYFEGGERFSKGIHHVSIARSPDEVWVANVGGWDRPPEMDGVVFNRIFRDFLRDHSIPFICESGGSKNMKVAREHFPGTLGRITDAVIDDAIRLHKRGR